MIYRGDFEQGTPEWLAIRCGKVTASKIKDVLAKAKSGNGESATRRNYMMQLVAERLTGCVAESYTNAAMAWGSQYEPEARNRYEFTSGLTVDQIAFADHPLIAMAGCSPDGILPDGAIWEAKCPITTTHLDWMISGGVPAEHQPQMFFQMDVLQAPYGIFTSYDPRLPFELQLYTARLERDETRIGEIRAEVIRFNEDVEETIKKLKSRAKIS